MTKEEISRCCQIPMEVLSAYEHWNLSGKKTEGDVRQYDDEDIQKLSMIITLTEAGLTKSQIECYMRLAEKDSTENRRMELLNKQREQVLSKIHVLEQQIEKLDYLRYQIRS